MDENKQEQMVSIIVPVYNAEAYLPEMIESVIFQNYNNWELLLIDNCSMDNSFEICQSYEKKDVRIRVMQETEKGPAAVRNHGLLAAHGGYIMFLDADDFLADNAVLDRFVNVMKHEEADIVVGNYERLWNGRRFAAASHTSFSELNPDSEDFRFQGFFSVGTLSYVWGKLYRKQFLEKNEAVFENLPYAEDKLFNIQCYLCNPKYAFIQEIGYIYRKNDDSISFTYRPNSLECWMAIAYRLQKLLTEKEIKQIRCLKDENAERECLEKNIGDLFII
ncbi:glycosyltransferase family 2 protein [Mediterraneibacter faecis]|uniref:glycosyltransferase family 2 protein n=1 Tax=Mediterraneibacter faecis TaxID=592978 RepID=UPI003F8AEE2E